MVESVVKNIEDKLIVGRSPWMRLTDVPSSKTKIAEEFWAEYPTQAGVYQVAKEEDLSEIGDDVIDDKIGYTGMSESLAYRVNSLRGNSAHNCGVYVNQQGWNKNNVYVRILFTEEGNAKRLEDYIHKETKIKTGKRFAWNLASGGNDGNVTKLLELINKLNTEEDAREAFVAIKDRYSEILIDRSLGEL